MTHLFEALLTNGFGVDLHLEDDGVGLADETPHLVAGCIQRGSANAHPFRLRGSGAPGNEGKTKKQNAPFTQNPRRGCLPRFFLRNRDWSVTGLTRYVLNHNRFKTRTRAQLSLRPHTRPRMSTTCSRYS